MTQISDDAGRTPAADSGEVREDTPQFDLGSVLATVRMNLLPIVSIIALALAAAVVWTLFQTPLYTATAAVQIDDAAAQVLEGQDETQSNSAPYDVERFLNTQMDVVRSRGLAEQVVDQQRLAADPQFFAAMEVEPAAVPSDRQQARALAASLLQSRLFATVPRQSRIARISLETADPQMSARLANAYAEQYIRSNLQRKFDSSAYSRQFLAEQLDEARQRLEESERDLNEYASAAGITRLRSGGSGDSAPVETSVTTESLLQLNTAANQARANRIQAESRWRAVAGSDPLASREVSSNATVQQLLASKAQAQAELQQELTQHLEEHPNVQRLRAQVSAIDAQLGRVISGLRAGVRSEYESARAAEAALSNQVDRLQGTSQREQELGVRYTVLEREAGTARALYDTLLSRYNQLTAAAGVANSNIALIDSAQVPIVPSSPNLMLNLAYALLLGLVLAALMVAVRMQLDDKVKTPEDLERLLGLPALGFIPKIEDGTPVEELADPKSPAAEAYASLRGAVGFAGGPELDALLVTSVSPAEGKSLTSYALATGYAQERGKVLLIDTDMRRPSSHKLFGLENNVGLSSVLTGEVAFHDALRAIGTNGLDVLTSGPIPGNPGELVASAAMRDLLARARNEYDMVIVDSPPVLGLADVPALASVVPATIIVIEAGLNGWRVLRNSLRRVHLSDGKVLGAALTKFDPGKVANYSGGYGYDYYAYGEGQRGARNRPGLLRRLTSG